MFNSLRQHIRATGRPLVAAARRMLTSREPEAILQHVQILSGPAFGLTIQLPVPSELADKICNNLYEPHCTEVCQLLIRPQDICFDVGAHYGYYTLLLSKLASDGQVHSFEPVPRLAVSIRESIRVSKLTNAAVNQVALSQVSGERILRYAVHDASDDSMNFLVEHGGVSSERSESQYGNFEECKVECRSLDELDLPAPNFIKMDVEGAEAAVLKGAQTLLAAARPRILIELHGVDLALQVSCCLTALGYVAMPIGPRGLVMPVLFVHRSDNEALDIMHRRFGKDHLYQQYREHRTGI